MKAGWTIMLVAAGLCVSVAGRTLAAEKIAVVDIGEVVKVYPRSQTSLAILEKEVEDFKAEQKELLDELEGLKDAARQAIKEAESTALNDEAREKKREIAEEKLVAMQDAERRARETIGFRQQQLADQQARMRRDVSAKLRELIAEYAEKNGYTLILNSSASLKGIDTVMYSRAKLDITEDIIDLVSDDEKQGD